MRKFKSRIPRNALHLRAGCKLLLMRKIPNNSSLTVVCKGAEASIKVEKGDSELILMRI